MNTKKKQNILLLIGEIFLTIAVCTVIIANSLSNLTLTTNQYSAEIESDYNTVIDNYINTFRYLKLMISEKLDHDPSFTELNTWLQSMDSKFKTASGSDTYDGIALTYKGGYAHSWNYGDYTNYSPSTRPWYQMAKNNNGEITIVPPYVTFLDQSDVDVDEYIIMSISQKHSDSIYFDYDIKIKEISKLLTTHILLYDNTDIVLFDKDGYILSSTDNTMYAHNINQTDDVIDSGISSLAMSNEKYLNSLSLTWVNNSLKYIYTYKMANGNTILILLPFINIFLSKFLFALILAMFLIGIELFIYISSSRHLKRIHEQDTKMLAVTKAAFDFHSAIDISTMTISLDDDTVIPYSGFFTKHRSKLLNDIEKAKVDTFLSPEVLKKCAPSSVMATETVKSCVINQNGTAQTRTRQLFRLVSIINGKKIVSLLFNDVTDAETQRMHILSSIADHYATAIITNSETFEYEVIKTLPEYSSTINNAHNYYDLIHSLANFFVKSEYQDEFLNAFKMENICKMFKTHETFELTVQLKNGNWITVHFIRCNDYENNHLFVQCVENTTKQMTQQELLKTALAKAEAATNAKSEFLSNMSHDMRTPMNAILGFSSLAKETKGLPSETYNFLDKILSSGEYLLGLINDVLDMSKIESHKFELHEEIVNGPIFLQGIADIFTAQAKLKNITLITDFSHSKTPWVKMDPLRSRQIYTNILSNAIKFSPPGSSIEWTINDTIISPETMTMICTITDHGCGMSKEFLDKLFMPFEQEQNKYSKSVNGTGLGLSIVKKLVDEMGGTIEVESELNKGTTFTIKLTRTITDKTDIAVNDKKQLTVDPMQIISGKRVLLCEDHPLNMEIALRLLNKANVAVKCAQNGKIGYEIFKSSPPNSFDAILMDIRMPEMNGIETTKAIRALDRDDAKHIPIIAMTANAFEDDVRECLNSGMNAHLLKPFKPAALFNTLAEFLQ